MREFPLNIGGGIENGLQPDERLGSNKPALLECKGVRPFAGSLVKIKSLPAPKFHIGSGYSSLSVSFPFPQLFIGRSINLLCYETSLYEVTPSSEDLWEYAEIPVTGTIALSGQPWQFMDFGSVWFLFNGTTYLYSDSSGSVNAATSPVLRTGCVLGARAVLGGFSTDFWSANWQTEWERICSQRGTGLSVDLELQGNQVWWTMIGGGDLLWLFDLDSAIYGPLGAGYGYDLDYPMYLEALHRGDSGIATMPWQGTVRAVHALGNNFVVYGDGGVTGMRSVLDPIPTFSMKHLLSTGVASRNHVMVGGNLHLFIDSTGVLWSINLDMEIRRLGFKEFLKPLLGEVVVATYYQSEDLYYIASTNRAFVCDGEKLSEATQLPTSIFTYSGVDYALSESLSNRLRVKTGPFDMGHRNLKQLRLVEIGYTDVKGLSVTAEVRYDNGAWLSFASVPALSGIAWPMATGDEFRVLLEGIPGDNVCIDSLIARWCSVDKRGYRGAYSVEAANA